MDYIFTPWRYAYITNAAKTDGKSGECIFCELPKLSDKEAKIVYRGKHCFIILNSFPYTSRPCDGGAVCPPGRAAKTAGGGGQ